MKTPWLKKIDLRKITKKDGYKINHPDINIRYKYLVKYDNLYLAGSFRRLWSGLYFYGYTDSAISLDNKHIKGIWQIRTR